MYDIELFLRKFKRRYFVGGLFDFFVGVFFEVITTYDFTECFILQINLKKTRSSILLRSGTAYYKVGQTLLLRVVQLFCVTK